MFDRRIGLIAGILYATTILPTAMAQVASHDVALIPSINLTLLLLFQACNAASRKTLVACLFGGGFFFSLVLLTKGFFGAAVIALVYSGYLVVTRQIRFTMLWQALVVFGIGIVMASPWYVAMELQNPGYLRYFLLERHFFGFATESQRHGDAPWWYYLPILLGGGLPWIGYLPIVIKNRRTASTPEAGGENVSTSASIAVLWIWLIGWTLLMMLAGSKLATYLWPVFPPIALLAATAWSGLLDGTLTESARQSFARTFAASSWCGPIVLPAAVCVVQIVFAVQLTWTTWVIIAFTAVATPWPLIYWRAKRWMAAFTAASLSLAVQFLVVMALVIPPTSTMFTARELAKYFNRRGCLPTRLFVAEGRVGSVVFYLDAKLRKGLTPDRIQAVLAENLPKLRDGDAVAIPELNMARMKACWKFENIPYEIIQPYRLYFATSSHPWEEQDFCHRFSQR
jgi:hypothetical protein